MKTVVDKFALVKWIIGLEDEAVLLQIKEIKEKEEQQKTEIKSVPVSLFSSANVGLGSITTDEAQSYCFSKDSVTGWNY